MEQLEAANQDLAIGYEERSYNKKGKLEGRVYFYNMAGKTIGYTDYNKKGEKDGDYTFQNPETGVTLTGQYEKGKKTGHWVAKNLNDKLMYTESYNKGKLLNRSQLTSDNGMRYKLSKGPAFKGGNQGWTEFLRANMKYPQAASSKGIQGAVKIKFIVLADGSLTSIEVTESPGAPLTKESLRIMGKSPKWIPAEIKGKPVSSTMRIEIWFKLK